MNSAVPYSNKLYGFYIKPVKFDRPVRIEFVSDKPGECADRIASAVYGMSVYESYGIPSVIIEADARAKLSKNLVEYVSRILRDKTGSPMLLKLRRELRPL